MSDIFENDKPVYWDSEKHMLYWIEWEETGNNDIPHRHYLSFPACKSTNKKKPEK